MTVKELIALLETFPQDLEVTYSCCSEQTLLEAHEVHVQDLCLPRNDGWVENKRPDKPTQQYLCFPGN